MRSAAWQPIALALLVAAVAGGDLLWRLDRAIYDLQLPLWARPAPPDVIVVAVDDDSLAELGSWPWPRSLHADLADRLSRAGARAIGIDVAFGEPDLHGGDEQLAEVLRACRCAVLPVLAATAAGGTQLVELMPVPPLAGAARLGHADVPLDRDGMVRGLFLEAGLGEARWPAFSVAVLEKAQPGIGSQIRGQHRPAEAAGAAHAWLRDRFVLLPSAGVPGNVHRVSFADVLRGSPGDDRFRDRIVLVGVTASGLAAAIPTPLAQEGAPLAGVEFEAQAIDALRSGTVLYPVEALVVALASALVVLVVQLSYPRVRRAGLLFGLALAVVLGGSLLLAQVAHAWMSPAAAIAGLALGYPLWLRRQRWLQGEALAHQASHDALTGLPNRALLTDRLNRALADARRNGKVVALLFIDLDRLKLVNDGLGHKAGDALLLVTARRLLGAVRESDTVARLGGDEFAVMLTGLAEEAAAVAVGGKLLSVLQGPVDLQGVEVAASASIGGALFPRDGDDADTLLKRADSAVYQAKDLGRGSMQFYSRNMGPEVLDRLRLERQLGDVLERGELELHYQPLVEAETGSLAGFEALVRWRHPELGLLGPDRFIAIAEETGLIFSIGHWVLGEACRQVRRWQDAGLPQAYVAVNLSARQFQQKDLGEIVGGALAASGLDGGWLCLEITESMIMRDLDGAVATMHALKGLGVRLSIDDFGTGYSSLAYLKRFPVDTLKIDRSFVRNIPDDPDDAAISLAVIAMAHSLRLKVIAEGVESASQLDFLRARACDGIQGYLVSRPVPAEEATRMLESAARSDGGAFRRGEPGSS